MSFQVLVSKNVFNGSEVNSVNLRDVWKFVQSKRDFQEWAKVRLVRGVEDVDFTTTRQRGINNIEKIDYIVTVDYAKLVCMLEDNAKGDELRRYFIECEKAVLARPMLPDFTDPVAAARAWADEFEAKKLALARAEEAEAVVFDLCNTHETMSMTHALKELGIKPKKAIAYLKEKNVLTMASFPTSYQMSTGRFSVKSIVCPDGVTRQQTLITGTGLVWLRNLAWPLELREASAK